MVKKILLFSTLFFILSIPNVYAGVSMPSPSSFQLQRYDGSSSSYGVRVAGWYNVQSYSSNNNYGGTYGVTDENVTRWNIWYNNSNICANKNATLYITINSYYAPFNTSQAPIMNYTSFLRVYNGTTDYTCSLNQSLNQGKTTTWTCNIIGTQNLLLHLETDMPSDTVYGFAVGQDSNYVCDTSADISNAINNSTQNIINNQNQNTQSIINSQNSTTNAITSEDDPNTNSSIQGFQNSLASDTPITDLITMPLTLLNAYINGMNSTCSPYNFGSLLGTNLTMPCINLQQRLGNNVWSIIDVLFSIFMIFNISKLFISAFNNFTSLKDDFSNMYTNDYQPKHGGED